MVSLLAICRSRSEWGLMVPGVFAGIAHAVLFPAVTAQGSAAFPNRYRGLGTTVMLAMLDLGMLIGAPLIGGMVEVSKSANLPAYPTTFLVLGVGITLTGIAYAFSSVANNRLRISSCSAAPNRRSLERPAASRPPIATTWLTSTTPASARLPPTPRLAARRSFASAALATGWSSIWAVAAASGRGHLTLAGYGVLGFDISEAMVALAQPACARMANSASNRFSRHALRPCVAVTALGEIFNYLFDRGTPRRGCTRLFGRVFKALRPGGLFVFDVAAPGRVPGGHRRTYSEGPDWACLVEAVEDAEPADRHAPHHQFS